MVALQEARYWENLCKNRHLYSNFIDLKMTDLVTVTHNVVDGDERLVDDGPIGLLRPLQQHVRHGGNRHVRLVRAV